MKKVIIILVVLAICASLRVWLIAHTEVIAKDGTIYVKMAPQFFGAPGRVARQYDYHVGYPAAMAAVHPLLRAAGWPDDLRTWELSGQVASLAASLAALVAVCLFARMLFNWPIAFITTILFGVGRKWSVLGSDVVSDALAVCLQVWGVVLAIWCFDRLKRGSKWSLALAAGVGLCCGLGYLVRPEALLVGALAAALWLGGQLRHRKSWPLTLGSVAASVVVTLACALPYMMAIGGITNKKGVDDIVSAPAGQVTALAAVCLGKVAAYAAVRQFVNQLFEAMGPVVAAFACVWLGHWLVTGRRQSQPEDPDLPRPRRAAAFMILGTLAVMGPLLMSMYAKVGYLSHRHVMFLGALLSPLAGAGVMASGGVILAILRRARQRRALQAVAAVVTVAAAIAMGLHTLRPLHEGKLYIRRAGQFAAETMKQGDYLLTDQQWVLHYAQAPGGRFWLGPRDAETLLPMIRQSNATHMALSDRYVSAISPKLPSKLIEPEFVEMRTFVQDRPKRPDTIRVYRINRGRSGP